MSKQIKINIYLPNKSTTSVVSLLSDLIAVKEVFNDPIINSMISYFGDPITPFNPTYVFRSSDTVGDIVGVSDNSLVEITAVAHDSNNQFPAPISFAFPASGFKIEPATGTNINAQVFYRGLSYYVSDTLDSLVTAANAGGGGGGSTLFALAGQNTATGLVIGELNGNELQVTNNTTALLDINPGHSGVLSTTDNIGIASVVLSSDGDGGYQAHLNANNGVNNVLIELDAVANTITQTAATNQIDGQLKIVDGTQANNYVLTSDGTGLASWKPTGGYKVWTGLLSQSGTSVPVITELANTLGVVLTPVYITVGQYALFDAGGTSNFNNSPVFIGGTQAGGSPTQRQVAIAGTLDGVTIYVNSFDNATGAFSDNVLSNTAVEIRVYT